MNKDMHIQHKVNKIARRNFCAQLSAGIAAFSVVPGHVLGLNGAESPNEKLNIAGIGVGGQGGSDLNNLSSQNIVALCDVDSDRAAATFKKFPNAKRFDDFRVMLDKVGKEIDAVTVGTPDHLHAVVAMRAMKMGKHVYCEKPLAHSIFEVRQLMQAARENKVITQLGNQGHSFDSIRVFREWIEAGAIGAVREVHAMCKSVYSRINQLEEVKKGQPVPATLNWDLWLGPAQFRPYHSTYVPGKWRSWRAFGTGVIGDWTCHVIDPVFWALGLEAPTHVEAIIARDYDPDKHSETFPAGNEIRFDFAAKGSRPAVKIVWYDGPQRPPRPAELDADEKLPDIGAVVIGDKGKIIYGSHGANGLRIVPDSKMEGFKTRPQKLAVSPGHHKEWIVACKRGKPAGSDFSYGGPLTEIALLGVIAMQFKGRKLEWDSQNMKFANIPEANNYLKPVFREGWNL
jgi:predicted dehydrogenase